MNGGSALVFNGFQLTRTVTPVHGPGDGLQFKPGTLTGRDAITFRLRRNWVIPKPVGYNHLKEENGPEYPGENTLALISIILVVLMAPTYTHTCVNHTDMYTNTNVRYIFHI